ncbi:hypothetical protein ACMG4P_10750 [Pseudovibrio denitrificans]|uniref:hypothetical protein n=1 Tax=Pseudovibrio denitrificans TaxID=258256 RepID=UPI0039BF202C
MSDIDLKEPSATDNYKQEVARLNKRLLHLEKRITIIEGKKARPIEKPEMSKAAQEMVETFFLI